MPTTDIATDTGSPRGRLGSPTRPPTRPVRLSPRERQIVTFITAGCSNQQIAACLGLKTQTVKNLLCRLYSKLGVSNRVHLAVYAVAHGMNSDNGDR
jgi:DNA-binding NarL/FixJ family response regulator